MRSRFSVVAIAAALAAATSARPAGAETIQCTPIVRVPYTIARSGLYCLRRNLNLAATGVTAITVNADDVVLDLNGRVLSGLAAGPNTQQVGISAESRRNVTIKNGTVRGFFAGIGLWNNAATSSGHVVEGIRADANTYIGISAHGNGILVRNTQILATGGTTSFGADASAFGIESRGVGNRITDNDIATVTKSGVGTARGIYHGLATDTLTAGNRITACDVGVEYAFGQTGKYRDNLTSGVTTPYVGGTDAGNNN